jgi:hypothetical protein
VVWFCAASSSELGFIGFEDEYDWILLQSSRRI